MEKDKTSSSDPLETQELSATLLLPSIRRSGGLAGKGQCLGSRQPDSGNSGQGTDSALNQAVEDPTLWKERSWILQLSLMQVLIHALILKPLLQPLGHEVTPGFGA